MTTIDPERTHTGIRSIGASTITSPPPRTCRPDPDPEALAAALLAVTSTPLLAQRLRQAGLAAVRERTWPASLAQLAAGYRSVTARTRRRGQARVA